MQELTTDLWSMLLPEDWEAEQEGETISIVDEDEASIIEITPLVPEDGKGSQALLDELVEGEAKKTTLAGLPALYREFEDDDMFWREWFCDAGTFVLVVSHGADISNRNMDDDAVDELLSTLLLVEA